MLVAVPVTALYAALPIPLTAPAATARLLVSVRPPIRSPVSVKNLGAALAILMMASLASAALFIDWPMLFTPMIPL